MASIKPFHASPIALKNASINPMPVSGINGSVVVAPGTNVVGVILFIVVVVAPLIVEVVAPLTQLCSCMHKSAWHPRLFA